MPQPQQMKAFISSVDIHGVRHPTHQQLPNTKTVIGKMLVTWHKVEVFMVRSRLDPSQWLLVVIQTADHRKCVFEHFKNSILFSRTNTELWELDSFESEIINPTLSTNYRYFGLFLVDVGYCSKN